MVQCTSCDILGQLISILCMLLIAGAVSLSLVGDYCLLSVHWAHWCINKDFKGHYHVAVGIGSGPL